MDYKLYVKIEEVADKYIPKFMSGLMSRDWPKALSAVRDAAAEYHQINLLEPHPTAQAAQDVPDDIKAIVSAALWAYKVQGAGV